MKPLRRKLLASNLITVAVAFTLFGALATWGLSSLSGAFLELTATRTESVRKSLDESFRQNAQKIREIYESALKSKGWNLIRKDGASLVSLFEDNSFGQVRDFLRQNFKDDPELLHASFFVSEGGEIKAWQLVTRDYPEGLGIPIEYSRGSGAWKAAYPGKGAVELQDGEAAALARVTQPRVELKEFRLADGAGSPRTVQAYECVIPVYRKGARPEAIARALRKGESVGYLRYVLSLEEMEKSVAEQKRNLEARLAELDADNRRAAERSRQVTGESLRRVFLFLGLSALLVLGLSYVLSRFWSRRITQPVLALTRVAERMARGEYRQEIAVRSDDEIGLFADSFREMSAAILKRDEDLAEINRNLEKLVEQRTLQLAEQLRNISNLLNNMKQAVFAVSEDGKIVPPVSRFAETVFDAPIEGKDVYEQIYPGLDRRGEVFSSLRTAMSTVYGEEELQWELMEENLPRQISYGDKTLKLAYSPLWDAERKLEKLMLVIEDITDMLRLEKKVAAEKEAGARRIRIIQELATLTPERIGDFLAGTSELLREARNPADAMRSLHTLKGNSRMLGLGLLATTVHELESGLSADGGGSAAAVATLEELFAEYTELATRIFRVSVEAAAPSGKRRLEDVFSPLGPMVRDLARTLGKEAALGASGGGIEVSGAAARLLGDALVHLVRNGLDHGIESPEERLSAGKPRSGALEISASESGGELCVRLRDDGRGIDLSRLGESALARGVVTAEALTRMADSEKLELVFSTGVSTRTEVTELSGRGIGMDAVRESLKKAGATIRLSSTHGKGTEFVIRLPLGRA